MRLLAGLACLLAAGRVRALPPQYDPTTAYHGESIHGFTVLVHQEVLAHEEDAAAARKEMTRQLQEVARVLPAEALAALRKVRIWVEWDQKPDGAAEFHPSAQWLEEHGYNPEKAGGVEISNARNFVRWSAAAQPCMVLHELAHAYHFLVLGEAQPDIAAAYRQAVERKLYDQVAYVGGGQQKAYALTNDKEYFAELSEAYFGKNDFYPFTRVELERHDPVGFQVLRKLWSPPRPPAASSESQALPPDGNRPQY